MVPKGFALGGWDVANLAVKAAAVVQSMVVISSWWRVCHDLWSLTSSALKVPLLLRPR